MFLNVILNVLGIKRSNCSMEIIYVNPGKETHCDIYQVLSAFMKIYYLSNILQVQNIAAFIHACNTNFCMLNYNFSNIFT